jgi:crossover junction endodeoxyribonuclease RuvC
MSSPNPSGRIILGVDPGLQRCGWGVILSEGPRLAFVGCGVVKTDPAAGLGLRLLAIMQGLEAAIAAHAPHEAAVEETYVNTNARAALALGQARGAAMAAAARCGLPIGEYPPATIKKAVVGTGAADKDQVQFMVRRLLPTAGVMGPDAADALAVAICHAAHAGGRRAG